MSEKIFEDDILDKYVIVADRNLRILSVFDDLRYDRSDIDMLSFGMRRHVLKCLKERGFHQTSGTRLVHPEHTLTNCILPKTRCQGASPFDAIRDVPRGNQDFYVLTPTQTACQLIQKYPLDQTVKKLESLVQKHPINLKKISDYLDRSEKHNEFIEAIGYIAFIQRQAVESAPLKHMRALG